MHYIVTGGAGFIGSHLSEALVSAGHSVTVLDDLSTGKRDYVPEAAELIVGDVADHDMVNCALADADGCFHLAAIASVQRCTEEWAASHKVNAGGMVNVLEAARAKKIPVVYASSAAVYGNQPAPVLELHGGMPVSTYGADKYTCEMHAQAGFYAHEIPSVGLRFFNVYGPRQDPTSPYSGVISIFANRLSKHAPITIYGDGEQMRDFIYVADVVEALTRSMKLLHEKPHSCNVLNVCTGAPISVNALATTLATLLNVSPSITYANPRAGEIRYSFGSNAKAREAIGFTPQVTLEEGLRKMLQSSA